jgi:phthiocerol/phenolphthiocerol synthesis type-I polyketide synthase E
MSPGRNMTDTMDKNTETGLELAVIGMAGRFPGAKTIEQFWENLKNGIESISFFSDKELEEVGIDPGMLKTPGYVKARGLLEDIGCFDSGFFNYTPKEAEIMDPQVRIFHECAWHALENAGYNPDTYGGLIGLYAGNAPNHHWLAQIFLSRGITPDSQFEASLLNEHFSTLVSYHLNLKGPALTIRTACSTSLAAIHMACVGLLSSECDMALAGGVCISLPQQSGYLYREGMMFSSDGHCRTFDARASGSVFGSGVGLVVLKRLADSRSDRDYIYAVVKGSAINNDGIRKVGYTAPSVEGQAEVIRAAYLMAGVEPETIGFLEAHGTATPLGDPVEIEALKEAFNTASKGFCAIGSVKTNVGHLNAASGAAGFIKTVLSLKHRQIPVSLNFETLNTKIDLENSPFYVNTKLSSWKDNSYPLRASVSSFGLGGTNVHVVLEESPGAGHTGNDPARLPDTGTRNYQLILLSAKTPPALDKMTQSLIKYLKINHNHLPNPDFNLADAAYTLQVGRTTFQYRKMLVCPTGDFDQAVKALSGNSKKVKTSFSKGGSTPNPIRNNSRNSKRRNNEEKACFFGKHSRGINKKENPPVVFVFAGQGFQYPQMGLDLYHTEPVFRREIDRCFEILEPVMDLKGILYPAAHPLPQPSPVQGNAKAQSQAGDGSEVMQAMLFTFEFALAKLLMKWGIKPWAMIGYSLGEYIAACLSGVFSLEEALKLVTIRGRLIDETPPGAMLSVPLPKNQVEPLLMRKDLSLAIVNGPSCVVGGTIKAVKAFEQEMKEKRLLCTPINIPRAVHCQLMETIGEKFVRKVSEVPLSKPQIPYISNVSGHWISVEEATNPGYWGDHLCSTARFSEGIIELLKEENTVFIEIGPGRVLSNIIRQIALQHKHEVKNPGPMTVNVVRHQQENISDDYFLLNKIGELWVQGLGIDWPAFYWEEKRYRIPLPVYPFAGNYYFMEKSPFLNGIMPSQHQEAAPEERQEVLLPTEAEPGPPLPQEDYAGPRNELEQRVSRVWEEILGYREIGIHDNFFDLNGDSLTAAQLISRIQQVYPVEISLQSFFLEPTIAHLAEVVKKLLVEKIKNLSPVEKKKLARQ